VTLERVPTMKQKAETKKAGGFDPKTFLSTIDSGRKIVAFAKKQTIFVQGDSCDAVFYLQTGKVKLTVVSKSGKEARWRAAALYRCAERYATRFASRSRPFGQLAECDTASTWPTTGAACRVYCQRGLIGCKHVILWRRILAFSVPNGKSSAT
jgi:hypothetical protein